MNTNSPTNPSRSFRFNLSRGIFWTRLILFAVLQGYCPGQDLRPVHELMKDLRSDDAGIAGQAIVDLEAYPSSPEIIRALVDHLGDKRPVFVTFRRTSPTDSFTSSGQGSISGLCASLLVRIGSDAVEPLLSIIQKSDRKEGVASYQFLQALRCLGQIGDPRATRSIRSYLVRKNAAMPEIAIESLGLLGDKSAWSVIRMYLTSDDDNVRAAAATAAGRLMGEEAATSLVGMLRDRDSKVKTNTLWVLQLLPANLSVSNAVAKCLKDSDEKVRNAAFYYYQYAGACAAAFPVLLDEYETNANKSKFVVLPSIQKCKDPDAVAVLSTLIKSDDAELADAATWASQQIGDERLVASLVFRFRKSSDNFRTRSLIVDALGAIGSNRAIEALESFKDDPDPGVRNRILHALPSNDTEVGRVSEGPAKALEKTTVVEEKAFGDIQTFITSLTPEGRLGNRKVIFNGKVYAPGDVMYLEFPLQLVKIEKDQVIVSHNGKTYTVLF